MEASMGENYSLTARKRVQAFFNDFRLENVPELPLDEVYVVWFCKTLQNWKALVSTTMPDGMYYEVTFNGDTKETYLDVYTKSLNLTIDAVVEGDPNQEVFDFLQKPYTD
jgi:hypothetical protein